MMTILKSNAVTATVAKAAALGRMFLALSIMLSFGGLAASAAVITISAGPLDAIYSQAGFGTNSISIFILASATVKSPTGTDLRNLDSNAKIDTLFGLGPDNGASLIVDAFFVDTIDSCGTAGDFVGCASQPGHDLVVQSAFAQTDAKEFDLGHELGHNLGLKHVDNAIPNLMNPNLNGSSLLDAAQIATILASPLVQNDIDIGNFIDIRPILVTTVPELGTWAMMLIGFALTGIVLRRRAVAAVTSLRNADAKG